ncbi:MAG: response regulator transcription factor [Acidobacteria bacterium]|nr:response regulator transcription factor [Acidobacteriota bacterium]
MSAPQVLIVEDDLSLADAVRYGLEREGYSCTVVGDGRDTVERFERGGIDLVLLDLMLPGLPGVDVCRAIRERGSTPIIVMSAKDSEVDKVLTLEMGADDYVTKPFGMRELVARVRALLRRAGSEHRQPAISSNVLAAGPVEIDVERHVARSRGVPVALPPKEFLLLEMLLRRVGRLCTRDQLIAEVWGPDYFGDTRTLDVHIRRLRHKIEGEPANPRHLRTVRGLGYKFEP